MPCGPVDALQLEMMHNALFVMMNGWLTVVVAAVLGFLVLSPAASSDGGKEEAENGECAADGVGGCSDRADLFSSGNRDLIFAEFSLFRKCMLRLHTASRWQRYLDLINSSLADYLHSSECKGEKGCGCYASVLESDLEVWREKGGVSWEDFQAAKHQGQRAVHYQIIDHKLYRQEECMFGPR